MKTDLRSRFSNFRSWKEFDDHEMVIVLSDEKTKLRGFVGIHNTHLGPALGGTRMQLYETQDDALKDALNLSKAMSYKCALAGLPFGGGKAVVIATDAGDRKETLAAYARMVDKLRGLFKTGTDVGISDQDVRHMADYTSHMLGVTPADRGDMTTSSMAALGVYYSIRESLKEVFGSDNPKGRTVSIKGVGKLGGELARLLHEDGASLIIADVDNQKCQDIAKRFKRVEITATDTIHSHKVDVYSPCALGGEFTPKTIRELQTTIVAGGANNQLIDNEIGDSLFKMNILYVPDYIANAGGLIYVADELEADGFRQDRVLQRVRAIRKTVREMFDQSRREKRPTHRVADSIAEKRMSITR